VSSVEAEVPFHDVDALGVVWHGHYYKYLEHARTALMRSRGLDVPELVERGVAMVVVDSGCRYLSPLRYGDRMRVDAWFRDVRHRLAVDYEIHNLTRDALAARAHTVLAALAPDGRLRLKTPRSVRERILGSGDRGA
jgi:acyl-CoA thioester hydrolase